MRTALVGAVESTRVALEVMVRRDFPPAALFTLPLSLAHRHSDFVDLRPLATSVGVPVREIGQINAPDALGRLRAHDLDILFVIGWSQLCSREILAVPRRGAIGFHPAPLPEQRGRAVIPWTILQGRRDTGASLFWLDEGVDSGDILLQERFAVAAAETAASLYAKHLGAMERMLGAAIALLRADRAPRLPQDHARATYCAKRERSDGLVDWSASARAVWTLVRAVGDPYPGAITFHKGRELVIWEADYVGGAPYVGLPGQVQAILDEGVLVQCGDGEHVLLRTVQPDGGERVPAGEILRRHQKLGVDVHALYTQLSMVAL